MKRFAHTDPRNYVLPGNTRQPMRYCDCVASDLSGSIFSQGFNGKLRIDNIEDATLSYLEAKRGIRVHDYVAFVTYHDYASVLCNFLPVNDSFHQLRRMASRLHTQPSGGTRLASGLNAAYKLIKEFRRISTPAALDSLMFRVIAYSDGHDHETTAGLQAAVKLKRLGVMLETLGVATTATDVNEKFLRSVATEDADGVHYRFLGDEDTLQRTFRKIATGTLTVDD